MEQENQNPPKGRKKRRSRIHRRADNRQLELTERRIAELDILYHHRLADSDVFRVVLKGSDQQILRELRRLWDDGYIDRPIEQWINAQEISRRKGQKRDNLCLNQQRNEGFARAGLFRAQNRP